MSDVIVSVVIPTFNRPEELTRCVAALTTSTLDPKLFEVIIVNDGGTSPESVVEAARGMLNIRILTQPNRGPGAARNYGAGAAHGKFVAFTDDDCIPSVDWLMKMTESLEQNPDSFHGGRTINMLGRNLFSEASQSLVDYVQGYYNDASAKRTRFFASNNFAVPTRRFEQLGGFDESLQTAEDRDLCRTWHGQGWPFQYVPAAIVSHAHNLGPMSFGKQHFAYGRGALPYWRKAECRSGSAFKVEPPGFYTGMLMHPFTHGMPAPTLISALIVVSQIANAMGFAYEAVTSLGAPQLAGQRRMKLS